MKRLAELAVLAALGLALSALWLNFARFDLGPRNGLAALVAGTAERPFVERQLAPLLVRSLIAIPGVEIPQAARLLVAMSCVGWLWALRWLAQLGTPGSAMVATVLAVGPVGLLFLSGGYVYDPLTLALFTLALALLAREHWLAYCVLFPLLVLSKETAILLVPVYALWAWDRALDREWIIGLWYQVMVFVFIKAMLAIAFAGNPGSTVEFHPLEQAAFLQDYPLPNVLALSVYGAGLAAALWRWRWQPPFLRAAAMLLPLMFAAYWVTGYPGEIRVFLEAYPVLYLLVWHTVWTRAALPTVATIARWIEGRRRWGPATDAMLDR